MFWPKGCRGVPPISVAQSTAPPPSKILESFGWADFFLLLFLFYLGNFSGNPLKLAAVNECNPVSFNRLTTSYFFAIYVFGKWSHDRTDQEICSTALQCWISRAPNGDTVP